MSLVGQIVDDDAISNSQLSVTDYLLQYTATVCLLGEVWAEKQT